MKAVVFTLGCKTNRYESDAIAETLRRAGCEVSDRLEDADVYVVNTCAVTAEAERKSRQAIARVKAKNPAARVYVCGCASEKSPEAFADKGVSGVIGTAGKNDLAARIAREIFSPSYENSGLKSESGLKPEPDAKQEPCSKSKRGSKFDFETKLEPGSKPEPDAKPEPGLKSESGSKSDPDVKPEPDAKSESGADPTRVGARETDPNCACREEGFRASDAFGVRNASGKAEAEYGAARAGQIKLPKSFPAVYEEFAVPPAVGRTRAELKIQDGCDNFCSYCVIPYLRGRSRSRTVESVVREAEYLDGKTREIVLTGINLSAYGKDLGTDLPALIGALRGVKARIRLGSFYVEGVTDELLRALGELQNFCPHFHLSLQSGDDGVLKAMNRKYGTDDYRRAVAKIRAAFPSAGVTTDVITGFPTETDAAAERTLRFLEEIGFSDLHVFVFSKREGTRAARLRELPPEVREARKEALLQLKAKSKRAFFEKNLGVTQSVLFEERIGDEEVGYSGNYLRVYRNFTESADAVAAVVPKILYKDGIK